MEAKPYIFYAITLLVFVKVNGTPLKKNSPGRENIDQNDLEYGKQLEDEDVRELKSLKSSGDASLSSSTLQKQSYVNINGAAREHAELSQQIDKNGQLVERVHQKIDSKQELESATPNTRIITEVEIPSKGIHKWMEQDSSREIQKKTYSKPKYSNADNAIANNLLEIFKMKNIVRYLPIEMAEYIYKTGDEKTVTMAIENYLQLGVLSRDEAIAYLQEIKSILNAMEEEDQRDKKQELQRHYIENLYGESRNKLDMNQALSDLKDIQQLIQTKFLKRAYSNDNSENSNTRYGYIPDDVENAEPYIDDDTPDRSAERDYKNLVENLQNVENLFSESSMEGVIYQLSKVLFYQSLSMNGFEAQESLKQFTNFLETQVDEGRISRSMEHKVLDILLAALANTLKEHPELLQRKKFKDHVNGSSTYKVVEKKNGDANKKRHSKMNFRVSGIMDGDKKH